MRRNRARALIPYRDSDFGTRLPLSLARAGPTRRAHRGEAHTAPPLPLPGGDGHGSSPSALPQHGFVLAGVPLLRARPREFGAQHPAARGVRCRRVPGPGDALGFPLIDPRVP